MVLYNYKYKISNPNIKYNIVHPKLEIFRGNIINAIFNKFYKICKKYNNNILLEKMNMIFILFCWANNNNVDPVIPYKTDNKYDYLQLKENLISYDLDPGKIIKEINFEYLLKFYIDQFDKVYTKLDINKPIDITYKSDTKTIIYKKKYVVKVLFIDKLDRFYNNRFSNKYALYFCIFYRYNILNADNQQLAVISNFKKDIRKHYGVNIELFASCINRIYNNYGSLFYDLEKHFGSLGSFNDITPIKGLYFANPPFDNNIMSNMATKLLACLEASDKSDNPLGFIITVPIWDGPTQKKINKLCKTNYVSDLPYDCNSILTKSKYLYKKYIFCKNNFPYYSFIQDRNINATNTYLFIIKNSLLEFDLSLFEKLLHRNKLQFINV